MAEHIRNCVNSIFKKHKPNGELPIHDCNKENCICILGYDEKQKFCIETDVALTVENICIQCAKQLSIVSNNIYLFGLVKTDGKTWLNMAKTLEPGVKNSNKYIFRLRYYSSSILRESDLINYLHKQFRNDFRSGIYPFHEKDEPKILGFGVTDITIDYNERNNGPFRMPSNLCQFFPKQIFKNVKWLKKVLLKNRIGDETRREVIRINSLEGLRKTFVEGVYNMFRDHMCKETFECRNLNHQVTVSVQRNDNTNEMCIALGNSAYFISSLRWIEIKSNNSVQLNFKRSPPIVLSFDDEESAVSFVSCIDGYFRLSYDFYNSLCEQVEPPSIKYMREHGFHGNIDKKYITDILRKKCHQPGCYLIQWNVVHPFLYHIACFNPKFNSRNANEEEILYETIDYSQKKYKEAFPSIINLLEHIKSSKMSQMLKPDKFALSNLLLCKPENYTGIQESVTKHSQPEIISQSDIFFQTEQALIGSGVFTDVKVGIHKGNGNKPVVVKQLKDFSDSPYYLQFFLNAIEDHYLLSKNPSFLQMEGIILKPKCGLVMEYANHKSVSQFLCRNTDVRVGLILKMAAKVSDGLMYLRGQSLVHGNLHCRNLLLCTMSQVKIADAGLVKVTDHLPLDSQVNNIRKPWLAPELQSNLQKPTCESDMFAFGSCLCEMLCFECNPPQENFQSQASCAHVCRLLIESKTVSKNDGNTEQFDAIYKEIHSLILKCRAKGSECRPKPGDVSTILLQLADKLGNTPELKYSVDDVELVKAVHSSDGAQTLCNHKWTRHFLKPPPITEEIKRLCSQVPRTNKSVALPNPLEIFKKDMAMDFVIGQGAFGKVWKITYKKNDEKKTAAFKEFHPKNQPSSLKLNLEFKILIELRHERIIQIYGFCNDPSGIILEYIDGSDLSKWLKSNKSTMVSIKTILIEIAEGMHYLQSKHITHLDLAARNILLTVDTHVKITDFGLAKQMDSDVYKVKSERSLPLCWSAPEVVNNEITTQADVWSYGVLMWECFSSGKWPELHNIKFDKEKYKRAWQDGQRLLKPEKCSEKHYELMKMCWEYKPQKRPNFDSIIQRLKPMKF
ncbi:tyrosine-protein kinase JAK1-like isoform X2 [Octopus sinensis]|uniref:Tyrosine-protein kinase JAK1-like isoform X2 n=1 Tax=Octopus sinensis TaxID=2607531 RepID=A0A7E6ER40_9MOLL|nr:tyrosine-protein kinase JAK1-like isoform X2 [Octopus sinensis]